MPYAPVGTCVWRPAHADQACWLTPIMTAMHAGLATGQKGVYKMPIGEGDGRGWGIWGGSLQDPAAHSHLQDQFIRAATGHHTCSLHLAPPAVIYCFGPPDRGEAVRRRLRLGAIMLDPVDPLNPTGGCCAPFLGLHCDRTCHEATLSPRRRGLASHACGSLYRIGSCGLQCTPPITCYNHHSIITYYNAGGSSDLACTACRRPHVPWSPWGCTWWCWRRRGRRRRGRTGAESAGAGQQPRPHVW